MTDRRLVTAEVRALLEAADYIEAHGHARHTYRDRGGSVCVLGALGAVTPGYTRAYRGALIRLSDYLNTALLVDWNDAEGRTQDEVVAALRAAATL